MTQHVTARLRLTAIARLNTTAIAPHCTYSSARLERKPGKKSKRQQRKMFLGLAGGWDGQESTCERFVTDMESRNNLFHHVVHSIYPETKQTVCLRERRRDYVAFELVSKRPDCSVHRRGIGGQEERGSHFCKCLSRPASLSGSDFFSLTCSGYVGN